MFPTWRDNIFLQIIQKLVYSSENMLPRYESLKCQKFTTSKREVNESTWTLKNILFNLIFKINAAKSLKNSLKMALIIDNLMSYICCLYLNSYSKSTDLSLVPSVNAVTTDECNPGSLRIGDGLRAR